MKRRGLAIILVIVSLMISLVSCNSNGVSAEDSKITNSDKESDKVPSDETILEDMNKSEIIDIYIQNELKKLKVDSIKIDKAKREDDKYTVYCKATQSDENYEVISDYILNYTLYDIGGWILDGFSMENSQIKPLTEVPESIVEGFLYSQGYTGIELISMDKYTPDNDTYTSNYRAEFVYPYATEIHNLKIESKFVGSVWENSIIENHVTEDWGNIYGRWLGNNISDVRSKQYINIEIKSIDIENGTVDYNYEFYTYNGFGSGKPIDLYTGNITSELKASSDDDYEFEFEFKHENCPVATIYIGRLYGMRVYADNNYEMEKE